MPPTPALVRPRRRPWSPRPLLLLAASAVAAAHAIGQTQTPPSAPTTPTSVLTPSVASSLAASPGGTDGQWRGTGGVGLSVTSGNTNTTTLTLNGEASRVTLVDRTALGANVNYGRSEVNGARNTTANKWSGFGQYDYNLSRRVYSFGKLNLEGDEIVHLTVRALVAGGLGYKIIDTDPTRLSVFSGAGYSRDRYSEPQTIDGQRTTRVARSSIFVGQESFHQFTPNTTFRQRLDVYSGISGDQAKIAKFTAGLAVAMTRTLGVTLDLVDNFNSRPPAGFKRNDVAFFTGVSVKLGAR